MKRTLLCLAVLFVCQTNVFAEKVLLQEQILNGSVVQCNDPNRGHWCDPKNNPPPAWDGRPMHGHPVTQAQRANPTQAQRAPGDPCSGFSGNKRIACEQAGNIAPLLGILGR